MRVTKLAVQEKKLELKERERKWQQLERVLKEDRQEQRKLDSLKQDERDKLQKELEELRVRERERERERERDKETLEERDQRRESERIEFVQAFVALQEHSRNSTQVRC